MKFVWISVMAIVGVVKSELAVNYIRSEAVGLNLKPSTLTASQVIRNQTSYSCAGTCAKRQSCLSFSFGNNECHLYESRIHPWETKSVQDSPGFNYYYMMQRCSTCPDQRPKQEEYQNLNGRRVAFKTCSTKLDIYSAMVACACQRGRLVAIVDQETQNAINEQIKKNGLDDKVWIGLSGTCKGNDKEYNLQRSDGKLVTYATPDVYRNWAPHNPNYDREVGITNDYTRGWKDRQYGDNYPYICEFL